MNKPMSDERLARMKAASAFVDPPGAMDELFVEIDRLRAALARVTDDSTREVIAAAILDAMTPGGYAWLADRMADAVHAAIRAVAAGEQTETCKWCNNPATGFAEWQGDNMAHPSCGEQGHGFNYKENRE